MKTCTYNQIIGYFLPSVCAMALLLVCPQAEVTGGGVPLSVVDCASLEVRAYPGLHVCGEICDVFGRIGGFNFYWAWVSGRLAGMGAAQGGVHPKAKKGKEDRKLAATAAAV